MKLLSYFTSAQGVFPFGAQRGLLARVGPYIGSHDGENTAVLFSSVRWTAASSSQWPHVLRFHRDLLLVQGSVL